MSRSRTNANNWAADITEVQAGTGITVTNGTGPTPTVTNSMATAIDAKGDLVVGSGADAFVRVPIGANNQVLTADSATTSGVKWAAPDPLTTKGDLFTFSTTEDRLPVGANGDTLMSDSSTATGLRYNPQNALANPIINGGFDIWQRGTSFASGTVAPYTADRFIFGRGAWSAGATISRQAVTDTTNLPNISFAARLQRDSGNTSAQTLFIDNTIESLNSRPFAGKTVTFSFYARAGANYSGGSFITNIYSGTGTDERITNGFTGQVQLAGGLSTLTTTWQRFAVVVTFPNNCNEIGFSQNYTPNGTAGANDWVETTGWQIDVGTYTASSAPTFRRSGGTLAGELAACQRYYIRLGNTAGNANQRLGVGPAAAGNAASITFYLPTRLRVPVTSIEYSTLQLWDGSGVFAITSAIINGGSDLAPNINFGVASGLTTRQFYEALTNNNSSGYIAFSAEL